MAVTTNAAGDVFVDGQNVGNTRSDPSLSTLSRDELQSLTSPQEPPSPPPDRDWSESEQFFTRDTSTTPFPSGTSVSDFFRNIFGPVGDLFYRGGEAIRENLPFVATDTPQGGGGFSGIRGTGPPGTQAAGMGIGSQAGGSPTKPTELTDAEANTIIDLINEDPPGDPSKLLKVDAQGARTPRSADLYQHWLNRLALVRNKEIGALSEKEFELAEREAETRIQNQTDRLAMERFRANRDFIRAIEEERRANEAFERADKERAQDFELQHREAARRRQEAEDAFGLAQQRLDEQIRANQEQERQQSEQMRRSENQALRQQFSQEQNAKLDRDLTRDEGVLSRNLARELAGLGFDQQEADRITRETIADERNSLERDLANQQIRLEDRKISLERELRNKGFEQQEADRLATVAIANADRQTRSEIAQLQSQTAISQSAISNPFGFGAISALGGLPRQQGPSGANPLLSGLDQLGFGVPEGTQAGQQTAPQDFFGGSTPTLGALGELPPETLQTLLAILGLTGTGQGTFTQQAAGVTPGTAPAPTTLFAGIPTGARG